MRSYDCVCNCWLKSNVYIAVIVDVSPASHSWGQIIAVWLISLQSDNRAFQYVDWSNESFLCIDQTSKQANFASCVQHNWIFFSPRGYEVQLTKGVFSSKPVQGKKFLESYRSKFVCRFPAVIISSKSIIQGLVNKFLTGYLLEKNRDYTTCSLIRNTELYRNTYGSIFMKIFVTTVYFHCSFVTLFVKQCNPLRTYFTSY
jgi:hypothetical protein